MVQDTTGQPNFLKNIYIYIFKKLRYPVVSCFISIEFKCFIWNPVWYPVHLFCYVKESKSLKFQEETFNHKFQGFIKKCKFSFVSYKR